MNASLSSVDQAKTTVVDLALRFGPRLLTAIIILGVGVLVGRWVSGWLTQALSRIDLEPPVRTLLARIGWILTVALFVILALENLGVELLPLIAGLSVIGAGVALATQGVLSNAVAGLTIIFTKPFRVGEYIAIVGVEGTVEAISIFNTTLGHVDNSRVVIPNRKVVGEILHNYGRIRQIEAQVGVAYDTDLESALRTLRETLEANPRVLRDPAPVVRTSALGDSAVTITVAPWVRIPDYVAASGEIHRGILEALRQRGIVIPAPQREVKLLNPLK